MDETKKITRNLSFIKKNITEIDNVIDILIEEGILGMAERNIILSEEDPIHSVLETILKKQAYTKFTKALRSTGNDRIVDRLQETEISVDEETPTLQKDQRDIYTDENYKTDVAYILQTDLESLTKENNNLKQQQAQIRRDLNSKQHKLLELNREVCTYQKQNIELSQRLSCLKRSDVINSIIDDAEGQLKSKDEKRVKIIEEVEVKNCEIDHLRDELEELRKEVDEKTDQIDMLTRELKYLREQHNSARGERKELKLKVENLNNNLEEKMQCMMNIISENKVSRTPRQSSFTRLTTQMRNHNRDNSKERSITEKNSVFPVLTGRKSNTPKLDDIKINSSPRESPRTRISRPQQFISPRYIFTSKNTMHKTIPKPKSEWK